MMTFLLLILIFFNLTKLTTCELGYTNIWVVVVYGNAEDARNVAKDNKFVYLEELVSGYHIFEQSSLKKRLLIPDHASERLLALDERVKWYQQQKLIRRDLRDRSYFNDPLWPSSWYINGNENHDLNVLKVYRKYNITGAGIHVSVVDDGLEKDHPDLKNNYDPDGSTDIRDKDQDPSPPPRNNHGTQCAGVIGASANNRICGVGIAYGSKIGGIRTLEDGGASGYMEAQAFKYKSEYIDIKSMSWGPTDDGQTIDGPLEPAIKAIEEGIKNGRNKLGTIFVFSAGNGGADDDSCAADGYNNLIHTISITAATSYNTSPRYTERCSAIMATTYSSGGSSGVVSTNTNKQCTSSFSGTSAAAPMASGIIALTLEANKQLTWRDVQYIIVLTAKRKKLQASDWTRNGLKLEVSHYFGFGLMDAFAMVELAKRWISPAEQHRCEAASMLDINKDMKEDDVANFSITTDGCKTNPSCSIQYLEHVENFVTLDIKNRGQFELFLTSPTGTVSQLFFKRPKDQEDQIIYKWRLLSVHFWGENPAGQWTLTVKNSRTTSSFKQWTLNFFGVDGMPEMYKPHSEDDDDDEDEEQQHSSPKIKTGKISATIDEKSGKRTKVPPPAKLTTKPDKFTKTDGPNSSTPGNTSGGNIYSTQSLLPLIFYSFLTLYLSNSYFAFLIAQMN